MNDLPDDLPGVPRHTRSVPVDGLDQLLRVGRRRRSIIAASTGGVAAAVALVVAVVSLQPAASQSLRYAGGDPLPTVTSTELALPVPTSIATPDLQPSPGPTPTATASSDAGGSQDQTPAPDNSAAAEPRVREDFTETPQDEAAPLACQQPPNGQAGPLYYGGASACTSGSGGASSAKRGGSVSATNSLCAPYGGGDVALGYDSGREHEVTVYDGDGAVIYVFSQTVNYPQGQHSRTVAAGHCLAWTGTWDTTFTDGRLVPAGAYRVRLGVRADSVDGRRTSKDEGGALEFTVTVQ